MFVNQLYPVHRITVRCKLLFILENQRVVRSAVLGVFGKPKNYNDNVAGISFTFTAVFLSDNVIN